MDEKYISIEYEVWQNKYLPMENLIQQLEWQLEQEKLKRDARITFEYVDYAGWRWKNFIGGIDISVNAPALSSEQKEDIVTSIMLTLEKKAGKAILTEKRAYELRKELQDEWETITQVERRIERRLQRIPRIIKWLFRLKY